MAARNERDRIGHCVAALLAQAYANFDVVVVDDGSDDGTAEVAEAAGATTTGFTLLRNHGRHGKKSALMMGIEGSTGDILAFTDADCLPGPDWVAGLVSMFADKTVVVAGYSPFRPRRGFLARMTALETASIAVMASGLIGLGLPTMCTARNLAYRRTAYQQSGGLDPIAHIPSGDDTLMLQRLAQFGEVRYGLDPVTHVATAPPPSFRAWFRQKSRHLSTVGRYAPGQLLATAIVRSIDVIIVLGIPAFILGFVGPAVLWALGVKLLADSAGLFVGLRLLGERKLLKHLPLLEVVYSPLLLLSALAGLTTRVPWR